MRFVADLGGRAVVVLGNHDLHLISQFEGVELSRKDDTLDDVLEAPDAKELVDWLRSRPMMHVDSGYAMVHAGLLPQWRIAQAAALAKEVERALVSPSYREFLGRMYGGQPDEWNDALEGWDRLRVIVNAMTRLRFCTPSGRMDFRAKGTAAPPGYRPWFEMRDDDETLVCGHWSALGLHTSAKLTALDSGCVWGGKLTGLRLEDRALFQVPCLGYQAAGGE
jgi:bis(5'-nucleosyl)-tetraphosphatase (symmetrical)